MGTKNSINRQTTVSCLQFDTTFESFQIWLLHRCVRDSSCYVPRFMFPSLFFNDSVESFKFDVCQLAKHHQTTYLLVRQKVVILLIWFMLTFEDLHEALSRAKWFVTSIDYSTHLTWIFLMKEKFEVLILFVKLICMIKTQFGKSIKCLHSNDEKKRKPWHV